MYSGKCLKRSEKYVQITDITFRPITISIEVFITVVGVKYTKYYFIVLIEQSDRNSYMSTTIGFYVILLFLNYSADDYEIQHEPWMTWLPQNKILK